MTTATPPPRKNIPQRLTEHDEKIAELERRVAALEVRR